VPPQLWRREEDQQDQTADRRRCLGLLLTVLATAAAVQDRDAAKPLLWNLRQAFPSIKVPGPTATMPASSSPAPKSRIAPALEIVKRPDDLHSFNGLTPQVGGAADLGVDHPQRTIRDYERPPGPQSLLNQAPPGFSSRLLSLFFNLRVRVVP
jgi:putative transposase